MARVYGYIRVSTDHQDLQRQKVLIRKYCNEHEHTLVGFIGEKVSGAKANRKGLNAVLQLTKKDADICIISELARLSREDDILNVMTDINTIRSNGLDLLILDSDTWIRASDTITALQVMQLVFMADGNARERRKIAERMKTGRYAKLVKNPYAYVGGPIPFGFKVVANEKYDENIKDDKEPKRILKEDAEQKRILEMMYTKIAGGYTLHRLAKEMVENGIIIVKGQLTNYQALISNILHNKLYIGQREYKGETFHIKPLIHQTLFDDAVEALGRNRWIVSYSTNFNPLKGLLYCTCGRSLYYANCKQYWYYKCYKKKDDGGNQICTNMGVKADTVIKAMWMAARSIIEQEEFLAQTSEKMAQLKREMDIANNAHDEYTLEIVRKKKVLEGYVETIEHLTNKNLIDTFQKKYEDTEEEIRKIEERKSKAFMTILSILDKVRELSKMEKDDVMENISIEYKSELLHKVVDKAVWCSTKLRKGFLQITYMNGLQEILLIQTDKAHSIILRLPATMSLDFDRRKIVSENQYYSVDEFLKKFDYSEWVLEETIFNNFAQRNNGATEKVVRVPMVDADVDNP